MSRHSTNLYGAITSSILAVIVMSLCFVSCSNDEAKVDPPPPAVYWRGAVDIDLDILTVGDVWTEQMQLRIQADAYTLTFLSSVRGTPLCDAEGTITSLTASSTTITPTTYFTDGTCRANEGPKGLFSVVFSAGGDSLTLETTTGSDVFRFRMERFRPSGSSPTAP